MSTQETAIKRELVKVDEVATMLAICTRGVWRLVQRGELPPPAKVGRAARWRFADVHAYIQRITGGSK